MPKRTGLGKGLDALIPVGEFEPAGEAYTFDTGISHIAINLIRPNPHQPRTRFNPEELAELAVSIREHGVIQPLLVTRSSEPDEYTLIAGERRLLAAQQAGLHKVPVIIREATELERVELALIENVQRADLGALETAEAYRQLADEFGLAHEEIASRVGKSRVTVTNTLRLLKLPASVQQALAESRISEGHARVLLSLPTPQAQDAALDTILKNDLLIGQKPARQPVIDPSPEVAEIESRLREALGTKVTLNHRKKGGTLVIHYYSDEELNTLITLMTRKPTD
jgi:ParB family chromosome partitioning protein